MEYDTEVMTPGGPTPRSVLHNDYTYPCDVLSDAYKNACAYSQPHWWAYVLALQPRSADFMRLGDLCRGLQLSSEAKLDCFMGIGVRAGNDQKVFSDPEPMGTLCDSAGANMSERLLCRSMAASYTFLTKGAAVAMAACDGLTAEALQYCKNYATGKTKYTRPEPLP
jgi:hypothetical protein